MVNFINSKKYMNDFIIIVFFLITFIKLKTIDLNIGDLELSFHEANNFHFSSKSLESLPNNLKIQINGKNSDINYIISYFKNDSTLTNRNQLSQSLSGKSFMWLNKEQIKNGFYLSVECSDLSCEYSLNITRKENIELELSQPYSYYITEDNKETSFVIKGNPNDLDIFNYKYNCKVSIWAKGNFDLITELKVKDYEKHPKYNAYLVFMESPQKFEFTFTIKGTIGDFINVGALFFDGYNICGHIIKDLGLEISPFFVKGKLDDAYFLFNNDNETINTMYHFDYEHEYSDFLNNEYCFIEKFTQIFMRVDPYDNYTFFSLQYIESTNHKTSEIKKIILYPPQKLGATYERNLKKDEIIGLIPMKPENDFKYLTYYTAVKQGEFKAFIYKCENYPLCKIDSGSLNNSEELIDFNSASISYDKSQIKDNISPINKNQNILLLSCQTESCKLFTSMYTNKNKLNIILSVPYYKYIKEKNEDNYFMSINKAILSSFSIIPGNTYIYINIEEISGKIEITPKENEIYLNKKLIKINRDKLDGFSLKINAKKNSIYSIGASIHTDDYDLLTPQINYLLKLNNKGKENTLIFVDDVKTDNSNYFGFSSQVCNIEVKYSNSIINGNETFYQDYQNINKNTKFIQYKVNKKENKDESCLFSTSMFNLDKQKYSIVLGSKVKYSFIFNEKNKEMTFMFIAPEKSDKLKVNIKIENNEEYDLNLLFNTKEFLINEINDSYFLEIDSAQIQKSENNNQPCSIYLILKSKNEKDSKVEIEIIQIENNEEDGKKEKNKNDHKTLYIILGVVGGVIVILLIVLFLVIKYKKKTNSNINEEIKGAFEPDGTNEMTLLQKENN